MPEKHGTPGQGDNAPLQREQLQTDETIRIKDYAIASSINGIAIGDLNGVVTYVNKAALSMWGSDDPAEIIGKSATVFAQSEQEAVQIMQTVLDHGEWSGEIAGRRKDGSSITVLLSASLVHDDDNRPLCMVCSFIDITDRKRMEEDLRVKESAIASSINGIVIGDLQGHVTYINSAALKMWGTDNPEDILGKQVTVFAQSEEEAVAIMRTVLDQGHWTGEITGRIMDGSPITVHLSASLVHNHAGEPICLMCSFIDISERKRIENELRIKDSAIASSLNGIGIGDLEGNILYVNEAALRMWGADDPSEVIGKSPLEFADSPEEALRVYQEFMEKGGWSGEISGRRKDGSLITVHLTASMVKNEKGEPICTMDSFLDITERKRMEEELRIKDLAIASAITGIGITDLEGNIIYVNDAALRMWGAEDASEVIGTSSFNLAKSHEEALEIYRAVLEHGSWSGEVSGFRKDGSPITILLSVSMVRNEKGEPVCGMDSFVDITERKRMEEELRIKDFAIASSIDGIGISDLEGNIMYVNDAALKMWGTDDASEVLGSSFLGFAQSQEEALEIYRTVLEQGSWSGEASGIRKDGSPIIVHLSASLVRNEKGEPICMMDSFVDITEQKRIEEELKIKDFAIASSINGIGISDLAGNIMYVNDAALKMWGDTDYSDMVGTSALALAQSEQEALEIYRTVLEQGSWSGEVSGYRKDGSPITVHLTASLVRNEKGEPICMMDSFVDITDRKRMEEELKVKDFAIASSINGIAIGDLEGTITYVNQAFLQLWGGTDPAEVIGKSALTFAQSQEDAAAILKSVYDKGNWMGEIIGIKKDGKPLAVQLSANMVKDDDGKPICLMCSFVDTTERKIAEQKLQRAYESLEQRVEERTEELVRANIRLKKEIEERKQAELSLLQKEDELRLQSMHLEETNTALKVLLKRGEQDKNDLEEKVLSNIRELALPYVEKLKATTLDEKQKTFLEILEANLTDIISPFLKKLSSQYLNLTPTEIQVANLIREGKATKEIAEILNISERAIEFHRNNIRDKLGLKKSKTNLRSYLLTLS
ncbi:MAG TPA: PAS domain S-box protein [Deltaproteobacteria bacterium]|nr:PAS domain S-box protein [Deltaproteobacteria bacterium]HQI82345.1 PAS domain S-box protein [Deltaproteobacteria bacterium]